MALAFFRQVLKYQSLNWDINFDRFVTVLRERLPGLVFSCDLSPNPRLRVWRKHYTLVRDDYIILVNGSLSSGNGPMASRDVVRDAVLNAMLAAGAIRSVSAPETIEMSIVPGGSQTPAALGLVNDPTRHFGNTPADFVRWAHNPAPGDHDYVNPPNCETPPPPPPQPCGQAGQPCCASNSCGQGLTCGDNTCRTPATTSGDSSGGGPPGGQPASTTHWKTYGIGAAVLTVVGVGAVLIWRSKEEPPAPTQPTS